MKALLAEAVKAREAMQRDLVELNVRLEQQQQNHDEYISQVRRRGGRGGEGGRKGRGGEGRGGEGKRREGGEAGRGRESSSVMSMKGLALVIMFCAA